MNRNKTVLVISSSHGQLGATASLLRDDGYSVSFENKVNDRLSLSGAELPALIISELADTDLDGLQLCRSVRRKQALATIPILLVGDLSKESSIVSDSFRCGASEYLQKPIDPSLLAHMCRNILANEKGKSSLTRPISTTTA